MSENTEVVKVEAEETEEVDHGPITPVKAAAVATKLLGREVPSQRMFTLSKPRADGSPGTIAQTPDSKSSREGGPGIILDGNSFAAWLNAQRNGTATQARTRLSEDELNELAAEFDVDEDAE